jgi:hypothetical protein
MNDYFDPESHTTIRFSCPTQTHAIEIACQAQTIVTVPRECPTCGIDLPDAYRLKLREILNVTRFHMHQLDDARHDIDINLAG